jgi:hypothetical protein
VGRLTKPDKRKGGAKTLAKCRRMGKLSRPPPPGSAQRSRGFAEGNVMKSLIAPGLVILVGSLHAANAVPERKLPAVDFSKMTCEEFWNKTIPNDRGPFLFWLSGYIGHQKNSPVLDPVQFTEKTKALSDYCTKQPNDSILSAAEKTFVN